MPQHSEALYLRLHRSKVAYFRFLLEAQEGLALFTSQGCDAKGREVLCLRFAPGARAAVLRFLDTAGPDCAPELLVG